MFLESTYGVAGDGLVSPSPAADKRISTIRSEFLRSIDCGPRYTRSARCTGTNRTFIQENNRCILFNAGFLRFRMLINMNFCADRTKLLHSLLNRQVVY